MPKKSLIAVLAAASVSLIVYGAIAWKENAAENVFDEMYHAEMKAVKNQKKIGLANMENIMDRARENVNYEGMPMSEYYKSSALEDKEQMGFVFLFDRAELYLSYSKELDKDISLIIRYSYNIEEKHLKNYVIIHDENLSDTFTVDDPRQIKKYLDTYNLTDRELKQRSHDILYKRVLPDWFEAYDSSYSIKDIGKMNIEKDVFLK